MGSMNILNDNMQLTSYLNTEGKDSNVLNSLIKIMWIVITEAGDMFILYQMYLIIAASKLKEILICIGFLSFFFFFCGGSIWSF